MREKEGVRGRVKEVEVKQTQEEQKTSAGNILESILGCDTLSPSSNFRYKLADLLMSSTIRPSLPAQL